MKRTLCLVLCLVCLASLTGCSAPTAAAPQQPAVTLPPAQSAFAAPTDDSGMAANITATLYLPSRDGQTLLAQYVTLPIAGTASHAEAVVRALLTYPANDEVQSLGSGVTLGLYGKTPVEVSGSVCTVNLSSSALQLDYDQRYTLFLALAATLGEVGTIRFVNVLVADQAVGLDISGNLAAGSLTAHPGEELPVLWEQMDARRTPLGADASLQPLAAAVTLYFPLDGAAGFLPETRNLTFSGQTPQQYTTGLLTALSAGAHYTDGVASMPDLDRMLLQAPEVTELADGGRMVTLYFIGDLEDRLRLLGIDPTSFIGALTYTITSFVPSVGAVRIYSGERLLTDLPANAVTSALVFESGIQRRRQFTPELMEPATIYLAAEHRLAPVVRYLPAGSSDDPRSLLALLMGGATGAEQNEGVTATLPSGMDRTDVLGMAIVGDTLLLNLSPRFERLIRQAGPDGELLLCYSIVSTVCQAKGTHRVQFFWNGEMFETLGGSLYWGGEFIFNTGLIDQIVG